MEPVNFLICPASASQLEITGDIESFMSPGGTAFNYEVSFDGETVRILDTIGRMVPFDISELPDLIEILHRISTYHTNYEKLNEYLLNKLTKGSCD